MYTTVLSSGVYWWVTAWKHQGFDARGRRHETAEAETQRRVGRVARTRERPKEHRGFRRIGPPHTRREPAPDPRDIQGSPHRQGSIETCPRVRASLGGVSSWAAPFPADGWTPPSQRRAEDPGLMVTEGPGADGPGSRIPLRTSHAFRRRLRTWLRSKITPRVAEPRTPLPGPRASDAFRSTAPGRDWTTLAPCPARGGALLAVRPDTPVPRLKRVVVELRARRSRLLTFTASWLAMPPTTAATL